MVGVVVRVVLAWTRVLMLVSVAPRAMAEPVPSSVDAQVAGGVVGDGGALGIDVRGRDGDDAIGGVVARESSGAVSGPRQDAVDGGWRGGEQDPVGGIDTETVPEKLRTLPVLRMKVPMVSAEVRPTAAWLALMVPVPCGGDGDGFAVIGGSCVFLKSRVPPFMVMTVESGIRLVLLAAAVLLSWRVPPVTEMPEVLGSEPLAPVSCSAPA